MRPSDEIQNRRLGRVAWGSMAIAALVAFLGLFPGQSLARPGDLIDGFGHHGISKRSLGAGSDQIPSDMAIQADGRVLVAGKGESPKKSLLARYLADGELDSEFGDRGVIRSTGDGWRAVDVRADGRIVVSGSRDGRIAIARYMPDGSADPSFGNQGVTLLDPPPPDPGDSDGLDLKLRVDLTAVRSVEGGGVRAIGTYYECGWDEFRECANMIEVGLGPDGAPDPGFGDGTGRVPLEPRGWNASAVILEDGEALVVRHEMFDGPHTYSSSFATSKIAADGSLEDGFSGGFFFVDNPITMARSIGAITLDSKGRILLATETAILRFDKSGDRDQSFGTDGIVGLDYYLTRFLNWPKAGFEIADVAEDSKGRILVSGGLRRDTRDGWQHSGFATRLLPDGQIDPTFSGDGLAPAWFGLSGTRRPKPLNSTRVTLSDDGSVVLAGQGPKGGGIRFTLARLEGGDAPHYRCAGRPADFIGTPGRDKVSLNSGVIVTRGGSDRVDAANAMVCSGSGPDRVHTRGGRNLVRAGRGDDLVHGGRGRDSIKGGPGRDRLHGQGNDDRIFGESGRDLITGGGGNDRLFGGPGADALYGGRGFDQLHGGRGRDRLRTGRVGRRIVDYIGSNGSVSMKLTRKGRRKAKARFRIDLDCGRAESRPNSSESIGPIKVNSRTGRFKSLSPDGLDDIGDFAYIEEIKGRFHGKVVSGTVRVIDSDHWSDNYTCWSGKSLKNAWVKFRAKRQTPPRQFARH